jgi:hypothetical protein
MLGSIQHMSWEGLQYFSANNAAWETYTCPFCSKEVSGVVVAVSNEGAWLRCPTCRKGAVLMGGILYPSAPFGPVVDGLPPEVEKAYNEARKCMSVGAFTAAELICRKILMHLAVDKGAKEGEPFAAYLTFLEKAGYVTPPMKGWVDLIRKHGNLATHELPAPDRQQAASTVMFAAELLRLVYEMEHMARRYTNQPGAAAP